MSLYSKPLYLRCRLDTAADINVKTVRVDKNLFHDYSLSKLGPVQANLRVYNFIKMTFIESWVLHPKSQILTFSITDLKDSVLLRCTDKLLLG